MIVVAPIVAALALAHCHLNGQLPDARCTPGAVETTDLQVICGTSTRTRRHVDEATRRAIFASYGVAFPPPRGAFQLDHLIPLELGGSNSTANLWPQPMADAKLKDVAEDIAHRRVCSRQMSLGDAQHAFMTDWRTIR